MSRTRQQLLAAFAADPQPITALMDATGYAGYMMVQECGDTQAHHTYNAVSSIRTFLIWAEAAGYAVPNDLVLAVEEIYSELPQ